MSNNKQSSSVEWLKKELEDYGSSSHLNLDWTTFDELCEQAKAMHKEEKKQVLKDYFAWHKSKGFVSHKKEDIEEFINETFGGNHE